LWNLSCQSCNIEVWNISNRPYSDKKAPGQFLRTFQNLTNFEILEILEIFEILEILEIFEIFEIFENFKIF